jgi:type IV pilus assembly protein PilN
MANINLLPWREQNRTEKKKEFFSLLASVCLFAGLASFLWVSAVESSISDQNARNAILDAEIVILSKQVREIKELKKQKAELLDRMKVIQDLQGTRPVIVRHFDEMVRAIPDGVFLKTLTSRGKVLSLTGIAESNNRVSSLMRNLDESGWFATPNLTSVKDANEYGEQANAFVMTVKTEVPKSQQQSKQEEL